MRKAFRRVRGGSVAGKKAGDSIGSSASASRSNHQLVRPPFVGISKRPMDHEVGKEADDHRKRLAGKRAPGTTTGPRARRQTHRPTAADRRSIPSAKPRNRRSPPPVHIGVSPLDARVAGGSHRGMINEVTLSIEWMVSDRTTASLTSDWSALPSSAKAEISPSHPHTWSSPPSGSSSHKKLHRSNGASVKSTIAPRNVQRVYSAFVRSCCPASRREHSQQPPAQANSGESGQKPS